MTKFESVGVSRQDGASSKDEAIAEFQKSCKVCCHRGLRIDCDRCSIAYTHKLTLAAFEVLSNT